MTLCIVDGQLLVPHFIRNCERLLRLLVDDSKHLIHHILGVLSHMNNHILLLLLVRGLGRHVGQWLCLNSAQQCPLVPGHWSPQLTSTMVSSK